MEPAWRRDVRPCNAAAEVQFLHKTGITWNYASDAGIVESLPGAPCRRYVVALVTSAGTRFLDPEQGDFGVHPCGRDGLCAPRRLAEIGARIDQWNGSEWREVWHLAPARMQSSKDLGYSRGLSAGDFKADRDELLARALAIGGW